MKNNENMNFISRFIWEGTEKLSIENIQEYIKAYFSSEEYRRLQTYGKYYEVQNPELLRRHIDRKNRNKLPNNFIPTAYYNTIVDSMAGYLFQNIQYTSENDQYKDALNEILEENHNEITDMLTGVRALAFNKAIELIYTVGDETATEIKFASIDPRSVIVIYDTAIDPSVICGIRIMQSYNKDYDYMIDVIYADEWQYYWMKDQKITEKESPRSLYFQECPIIEYKTEIINNNSSFHSILAYIDALDYLVTGNSNEIERLIDALLVLGKNLKDSDLEHMDEWKALLNMKTDERAEYLTKNLDPVFREYVSKLLIQEIHKHSHVIDWYSPDTGLTGAVSGKALITRLFDMNMYSKRIEKVFRLGIEKRIRLLNHLMNIKSMPVDDYDIIFNRTLPEDIEDKIVALNPATFIDDQTKCELCGLDWAKIKPRLDAQRAERDKKLIDMYNQSKQDQAEK